MLNREMELVDIPPVEMSPRDEIHPLETDTLLSQTSKPMDKDIQLLKASTFEDLCGAAGDAKILAPLCAIIFALIGIYVAIDPFGDYIRPAKRLTPDEFKMVRPVLTPDEMGRIHVNHMYAETVFSLPEPYYDVVGAKFMRTATKEGHHKLPTIFYTGVIYTVSAENSHNLEYSDRRRLFAKTDEEFLAELRSDLERMEPRPTSVFNRVSHNSDTDWTENGLAVYFALDDLQKQGYLSSDKHAPWKRTEEPVLTIARKHRQVLVTQWYPSKFGRQDAPVLQEDPYRHTTVVRQVLPTRTGLNSIKSTGAVWLSAVNNTPPTQPPKMIRKMWTSEDHWTHYPITNQEKDQLAEKQMKVMS